MPVSNGRFSKPIRLKEDLANFFGMTANLGNIIKNGNINRYSYIKPVDIDSISPIDFTNQIYINSLTTIVYKAGDPVPTDFYYPYKKPTKWYRMLDFDGYDHNEYPVRGGLGSMPSTIDYEYQNNFGIYYDQSSKALLSMLMTQNPSGGLIGYVKIILVINVSGVNRVFALPQYAFTSNIAKFDLIQKDLYLLLRNNGAQTFNCTAFIVGLPSPHEDSSSYDLHEITNSGLTFPCYPASPVCVPNKTFVMNRPRRRCFMTLHINDSGNGREYYVPNNTSIQAMLKYNDEQIFVLSSYGFDQGEIYEDEDSRLNETTNYVSGEVQIPDVQFLPNPSWIKPEIAHDADRVVYDEGLHTTYLYWDKKVASDVFEISVGFTYADPNYRPEG